MKTLLITDDDPAIRVLLTEVFSMHVKECSILTANNGEDALKTLKSATVDLILTDLEMPVMDGYEFLSHLRKGHPEIPVLVMTGADADKTEERLHGLGISHYFVKPFNIKDLVPDILSRLGDSLALSGVVRVS